jgi:hypothetical protein
MLSDEAKNTWLALNCWATLYGIPRAYPVEDVAFNAHVAEAVAVTPLHRLSNPAAPFR